MAGDSVSLYGGILFLLIAVVGGGFSVKEVRIPRVPAWARIVSAVLGCFLTGFYLWKQLPLDGSDGPHVLKEQTVGEIGIHGLQIRNLRVTGPGKATKIGDPITVAFTLVSVVGRPAPARLVATYVSAEDPLGNERDFGWSRTNTDLVKDAAVTASHDLVLDVPGVWSVWPCYAIDLPDGGEEDDYCRRWNAFAIRIGE